MKRSWIPAALMGCLVLGYLAGSEGCGSRGEGSPPQAVSPPAAVPAPPAPPANPPVGQPPPLPIPTPALDDGLGEYPAWNGVDLDCSDIGHPVRVTGPDPHRLDSNGDGIGCEGH